MLNQSLLYSLLLYQYLLTPTHAIHHMKLPPNTTNNTTTNKRDSPPPLVQFRITNSCPDDIYPAIFTQAGTGPGFGGFHASPGNTTNFTVSADWQGRIWGRTNCSFNAEGTGPANTNSTGTGGRACLTGDCEGVVDCKGSVRLSTIINHLPRFYADADADTWTGLTRHPHRIHPLSHSNNNDHE